MNVFHFNQYQLKKTQENFPKNKNKLFQLQQLQTIQHKNIKMHTESKVKNNAWFTTNSYLGSHSQEKLTVSSEFPSTCV